MLNYVRLYRMVCITGRFGGGKTTLAVWLAKWLCEHNYTRFIASNIRLTVGTLVATITSAELRSFAGGRPVYKDCAIIMDEAWLELGRGKSRKQVEAWLAFLRKGNNFLLMPSVLPLVSDVTKLEVERRFNGSVFGLPLWLYRWRLGDPKRGGDRGHFLFGYPQRTFGLFDTVEIPGDDFNVYEIWKEGE